SRGLGGSPIDATSASKRLCTRRSRSAQKSRANADAECESMVCLTPPAWCSSTRPATSTVRLRGCCLPGERLIGYAPHGHWKNDHAGLRDRAMVAPLALKGAINGSRVLAYVKLFLLPTLNPLSSSFSPARLPHACNLQGSPNGLMRDGLRIGLVDDP